MFISTEKILFYKAEIIDLFGVGVALENFLVPLQAKKKNKKSNFQLSLPYPFCCPWFLNVYI